MRIYVYRFLDGTGTVLLNEKGDVTEIYGVDVELVGYTEMSLTVIVDDPLKQSHEKEALEG